MTAQQSPSRGPSAARSAAASVLIRVDEHDAYANLELNKQLRQHQLSSQDSAFVTELVSGTLREQLLYDEVIHRASGRSADSLDVVTRAILRMSAHQLLTLESPPYAVVNEAVDLQKQLGKRGGAGLVNAVVRRISERTKSEWLTELLHDTDSEDRRLSVTYSHQEWIIRAFREALRAEGREAELVPLLEADNTAPPVNLAVLTSAEDTRGSAASHDPQSHPEVTFTGPSPIGAVMRRGSPAALIRSIQAGDSSHVRVQDQGSQLAALALARVSRPADASHETWLDVCAGPGGKTAVLAFEAARAGASLRALELSEHRTELVREALSHAPIPVDVVTGDATTDEAYAGETFHRILVDAPCTGLGALRRRPDARLRKSIKDVGELVDTQREILEQAIQHLRPGGVVAYITCSPLLAETRGNVEAVLSRHPEVTELDARAVVASIAREPLDLPDAFRSVQLWPHRHGTDAMFISLLQRRLES